MVIPCFQESSTSFRTLNASIVRTACAEAPATQLVGKVKRPQSMRRAPFALSPYSKSDQKGSIYHGNPGFSRRLVITSWCFGAGNVLIARLGFPVEHVCFLVSLHFPTCNLTFWGSSGFEPGPN